MQRSLCRRMVDYEGLSFFAIAEVSSLVEKRTLRKRTDMPKPRPVPLKGTIALRPRCTLRAKVVKGRKSTIASSLCSSCQATGDDVNVVNLLYIGILNRQC